ncbi:hypothetical protein P154DRAFT_422241 [Amniculicola lignicola CBS 123094]|uniref:Polarized growth protein Boi2 n=1 Tax=Amniculicola lignicola CBS 123094 TaxID=1392246 RepID=A0A6A5WZU7_9PLEO|nr:hypothetical protein P154DRAFT_422241 [Amniculicola lignicola CBS 123094]
MAEGARPGDLLIVVHEFQARSPDELTLARGDRIELIERDDDFGDGWFLGKNAQSGDSGLFPEVYTRLAPKPTINAALHFRAPSNLSTTSAAPAAPATHHPEPPAVEHTTPSTDSQNASSFVTADSTAPSSVESQPRSISMALSGDVAGDEGSIGSPVMHETLSVIDEHITDMSTPRHSIAGKDLRGNDSGSEYSSHHRLSYIHGHETDEEEQHLHTEADVMSWTAARVAEYLEDLGVEKKHCDIFKEQEINGEALLGMDQATIFLKEFQLGPVGPRLRTWMKIKALQQEVKTVKDAAKAIHHFEAPEPPLHEPPRNRATSMGAVLPRIPSLRDGQGAKPRQPMPRANSTAGHMPPPGMEATAPLSQPLPSPQAGTPTRPSAASVRNMNHNRRHSSIDYSLNPNPPTPGSAKAHFPPTPHKKTPSFDRNWSMGSPQHPPHMLEAMRPSSSSNHGHSASTDTGQREFGMSTVTSIDLDRGYFSGGELDNRKGRNVLRKKESPGHSRNPSYNSAYNRRHSRMGSGVSTADPVSPMSPAAQKYYGTGGKSHRSSSAFDFVKPMKPMSDISPAVTKLEYGDSPSIDAIANSPALPGSEASSQGRASPSPAVQSQSHSHSFFSKKGRGGGGLRAISDAITGSERAHASGSDLPASPIKESPVQSPTRTGSSTPSATSVSNSKSFEETSDLLNKRLTGGSSMSASGRKKSKKHGTSAYLRGRQQVTPQEAMAGCDYSGWMKKKSSSLMTTWKSRLFVLRGRRLSYYYSENDTEEKGLIDISSHRVLPANNEFMTGLHAAITRASSSPSSPQNPTIPTAASAASAQAVGEDMTGMFIFKLVPPRAGLQKGVQFTKPIVHYFAVDNIQLGRLWMAALMKATIDRDDALSITTTYQQKTISLDKARAMRQRPPALMDDEEDNASSKKSKEVESIQGSVIHEEDEKQGLAISGLDDARALLDYAESGPEPEKSPAYDIKQESSNHVNGDSKSPKLSPLVSPVIGT